MESPSTQRHGDIPLAVQAWPFNEALQMGLDDALLRPKDLQFDEIEIAGNRGSEPRAFARAADATGLKILGTHEPGLHADSLDADIEHLLRRVELLNCQYATLSTCRAGQRRRSIREDYLRSAPAYCRAADCLSSAGKHLTIHPYTRDLIPFSDTDAACGLDLLLEHCPRLDVEIDLYFLQRAASLARIDARSMYRRYSSRIRLCHVRNVSIIHDRLHEVPLAVGGELRLEEWLIASSPHVAHFILEFDPLAIEGINAIDFARQGRSAWNQIGRRT